MTVGTCVGPQGVVPLQGESEIKQITVGTDILTITGAASQTGDYLVCRNSADTEFFALTSSGVFVASSISGIGAQTVGGALTVTGAASLNSAVTVAKALTVTSSAVLSSLVSCGAGLNVTGAVSIASAVGFNGATAVGRIGIAAAGSTSTGASGADTTVNYLTVVNLVNSMRTALISVGICT